MTTLTCIARSTDLGKSLISLNVGSRLASAIHQTLLSCLHAGGWQDVCLDAQATKLKHQLSYEQRKDLSAEVNAAKAEVIQVQETLHKLEAEAKAAAASAEALEKELATEVCHLLCPNACTSILPYFPILVTPETPDIHAHARLKNNPNKRAAVFSVVTVVEASCSIPVPEYSA